MQITITLPESFEFTMRKGAVTIPVDMTRLSADIIARSVLHGIKQKVGDGAANATMNAVLAVTGNQREGEAKAAFDKRLAEAAKSLPMDAVNKEAERLSLKVLDNLYADQWGAERGESGPAMEVELITYAWTVYRAALARDIKGLADMKAPDRKAAIDTWLDAKPGRRDTIRTKVAEEKALAADI